MKLISTGINGKIVNAIYNLYANAKSCVKHNGNVSDSFACNVGVRQGENLSPLLFAIYLNDFELFVSNSYKGLEFISQQAKNYLCDEDVEVFLRLYVLLYADDTIVMAESPNDLQDALNAVFDYCSTWKLTVNTSKTKVVIFSKGKTRNVPGFTFGPDSLEVVDDYTYLGVTFDYNGKFKKAINKQVMAARRALFVLQKKARILKLPIDVQIELFDKTVLPILLYGSEVWGFSKNIEQIEIFYRKFLKGILRINNCTPNPMVYGESGKTTINICIKERMINFWMRLHYGKQSKLSILLFKIMKTKHDDPLNNYKSEWITYIKNTFDDAGFSNLWFEAPLVLTQANVPWSYVNWLKNSLHLRLNDIFKQDWNSQLQSNRQCSNYRIFKETFQLEPYLCILNEKDKINMCKFRCRSFNLPVTTATLYNSDDVSSDICMLCNTNEIGDEFHYILKCPYFSLTRSKFLKVDNKRINCLQMKELFTNLSISKLKSLSSFISEVISHFKIKKERKNKKETLYIPQSITRSGRIAKQPIKLDL